MFAKDGFVLQVSSHTKGSMERLLSNGKQGLAGKLGGAIVDATFAADNPEFLKRLRDLRIPYAVNPLSYQFGQSGFERFRSLAGLPYAPRQAIDPYHPSKALDDLIRRSLEFQASHGASIFITPAVPILKPTKGAVAVFKRAHEVAAESVGRDFDRRPLLGLVVPSLTVIRSPYAVYEPLVDRAIDGLYVLPASWAPRQAGVDWLVSFLRFVQFADDYKLPLIASRAGPFGLLLLAFGVHAFDSGLGERETFNLSSVNEVRQRSETESGGGPRSRTYLPQLLSSVSDFELNTLLDEPGLRPWFMCDKGSCANGYEMLTEARHEHFAHTRPDEIEQLTSLPAQMRIQHIADRIQTAKDTSRLANRILKKKGSPGLNVNHLDVWGSVMTRATEKLLVGSAR